MADTQGEPEAPRWWHIAINVQQGYGVYFFRELGDGEYEERHDSEEFLNALVSERDSLRGRVEELEGKAALADEVLGVHGLRWTYERSATAWFVRNPYEPKGFHVETERDARKAVAHLNMLEDVNIALNAKNDALEAEASALRAKADVFDRFCAWAAWRREHGGFDDTDQAFLDLRTVIEAGMAVTMPRHWVTTDEESRAHMVAPDENALTQGDTPTGGQDG